MNRTPLITLAAGLGVGFLSPAMGQADDRAEPQARFLGGDAGKPYDPGSLLVRFREGAAAEVQDTAAALVGGTVVRRFTPVPGLVSIRLVGMDSADAAGVMARMPFVEFAEPDYIQTAHATTPSDPSFSLQWALNNTGQTVNGDPGVSGFDVNGPEAWDILTDASAIVVAVIDSGMRTTHEDLKNVLWTNAAEASGVAGVDDDGNGFVDDVNGWDFRDEDNNVADDHGHGTHVAGIIGAQGNNGKGIAGVAWKSSIMPLRFARKTSSGKASGSVSDAVEAVVYAVANGAKVINYSYGGTSFSLAFWAALDYARAMDVMFVCSAGNDGLDLDSNVSYPTHYGWDNIVSVAAIDNDGDLASFSNHGTSCVDIAAPGVGILSTWRSNNTSYAFSDGTSMAAPYVAGAASLLWAQNPSWSRARIQDRLLTLGSVNGNFSGKTVDDKYVNAWKALVRDEPETPTGAAAEQRYGSGVLSARVTWNDESEWEDGFKIERSTYSSALNAWSTFTQVGTVSEGVERFEEERPEGRYCYRVRAFNAAGDSDASNSAFVTVELQTPDAPSDCTVTDGGSMFPDIARVTWTDNSDDEDGFVIWRGRYSSGMGRWIYGKAGTVSANSTVFAEAPGSGEWRYKVRAYNAAGNSAFSNWDGITLP